MPRHPFVDATRRTHTHAVSLCRLCLASNTPSQHCHLRRPTPSPALKDSIPRRPRVIRPPIIHQRIHDRIQGHLRRHLLESVMGHRSPEDVCFEGDQPDGEGDVRLPRVEPQRCWRGGDGL